jgi:hypothetical protein
VTPRFRAKIKRERPLAVSGWRWVVVDMNRLPSQRVVLVGVRGSQPEALQAACAQIKRCSGGGS